MTSKSFLIAIVMLSSTFLSVGQITDKNGDTFKIVKIGAQEWMATNLNVTRFRNSDLIPQAKTAEEWQQAGTEGTPAWCYYNYDSSNGKIYGKLYNWYAVIDSRGLSPKGWHVPSELEWNSLSAYLGGETEAGIKMKSKLGWEIEGEGINESNFTGLPGGGCRGDGTFYGLKSLCYWWSSSDNEMNLALFRLLSSSDNELGEGYNGKGYGHSIRCVKD